jgi:hypothetical protein
MLLPWLAFITPLLSALLAFALSAFVLSRNYRAWVNRLLAIGLATTGFFQAVMLASELAVSVPARLILFRVALGIGAAIPPSWLAFSLVFGESNGGSRLTRWRPALLSLIAVLPLTWIALAIGLVIQPLQLGSAKAIFVGLDGWGKVYYCVYVVGLSLVLLHFENLYRHAPRLTRWKIKFLVVGVFVAFGFQIVVASSALLYRVIHPLHLFFGALALLLGEIMIAFSLVRHRLLDVDIFVSRYVVYRSLTLALIGGYLFLLGLAAEILKLLSIPLDLLSGTFLAMAGAVALCLLLLSEQARKKTQRFLHTHFYKHKYDYRVQWTEFTHLLARASTIPDIATQTVNRILEVMWVRRAAIYTAGDAPGQMVLTHQVDYAALPAVLQVSDTARRALEAEIDLAGSTTGTINHSDSVTAVARSVLNLGDVPVGLVIPVSSLDTMVGLLVVGPELSGEPFGVDDWDLLVAVAAQSGALMVNARLARQAAEGRELQVLARLSAFVAHDLKNSVSMLSMLVENAPQHMHEPPFQADAVRTLSEVTGRMRKLLSALATPSRRADGTPQRFRLAEAMETWVRDSAAQIPSRVRLEKHLQGTREVCADPEQLRSVLNNLLLNSIEAISGEGIVRIETSDEPAFAVFHVSDTGRGMTPEFIRDRLFRAFQTTKPRGLGIGMYQCRHIIEALNGTLTVESEESHGTHVTVRLPAAPTVESASLIHSPSHTPDDGRPATSEVSATPDSAVLGRRI